MNAALDPVDTIQWTTPNMYLKQVDKFEVYEDNPTPPLLVHCFITPNNTKFLLLHESKPEDAIKQFFNEVYEAFTRMELSPFFDQN